LQEHGHSRLRLPLWAAAVFVSGAGATSGSAVEILHAKPFDPFLGCYNYPAFGVSTRGLALSCLIGAAVALTTWMILTRTGSRRTPGHSALAFSPCYLLIILVPEYLWLDGPHIYSRFLFVLCVGAALTLGILLTRTPGRETRPSLRLALAFCLIVTALHALLFSWLSIRMFQAMNLGYTDSGVWAEALSNTLRGRFLHSNVFPSGNVLGDHMVPVLVLILPLFAIFPRHETIHVINAVALSAGAVPVFFLAWWRWRMPWPALMLSIAYLVFPSISHLVFCYSYGFHPVILSLPLLLAALYLLVRGKLIRFWIFLSLALLCNETVAIVVAALPVFILFRLKRKYLAAGVFVIGGAWFFLAVKVLIPFFRGGEPYWQVGSLYAHAGGSMSGMARYAAAHPLSVAKLVFTARKLNYILQLIVPLGLLPLLSPAALAGAASTALLLLLAERPDIQSIAFWNQATLIPFIFLAAVDSVGKLAGVPLRSPERSAPSQSRSVRITALAAFMLAASLASGYFFGYSPLSRGFNPNLFEVSERDALVKELRRIIPRDASLCATDRVASHFIDQANLFVFMGELEEAQYVLLDLDDNWRPTEPVLEWRDDLLQGNDYGLVYFRERFLLFEKGAADSPDYAKLIAPAEIPTEAQRIGLASPEGISLEAVASQPVGDPSQGKYRVTLYWSATKAVEHDYAVGLIAAAPEGQTLIPPRHLMYGAHPTSFWIPGEIYSESLEMSLPFDPRTTTWTMGFRIIPEQDVVPAH